MNPGLLGSVGCWSNEMKMKVDDGVVRGVKLGGYPWIYSMLAPK